jgi:hypothetical protein
MALYFVSRKKKEKRCARLQYPPGQRRAVRKGYLARRALLRFGLRHVGGHENVLIILHPCFFFLCRECASAPCVSRLSRWSPRARQIKERPGKKGAIDLGVQSLPVVSLKWEKNKLPLSALLAQTGVIGRTADAVASKSHLSLYKSRSILLSGCVHHKKTTAVSPTATKIRACDLMVFFLIKRRKFLARVRIWFAQKRDRRDRPRT